MPGYPYVFRYDSEGFASEHYFDRSSVNENSVDKFRYFFAALCHVAIEARLVALRAPHGFWLKGSCASRQARANLKMDHWSFTHATDGENSTVAGVLGCRFM
jgi:hypothetical protein